MRDWLAVVVPLGLLFLLLQGWLEPWDARLTDPWFVEAGRTLPIDDRIRLVEVDDQSLADLKAQGHEQATIPWVGPYGFYNKQCGARIDRVFWRYEK